MKSSITMNSIDILTVSINQDFLTDIIKNRFVFSTILLAEESLGIYIHYSIGISVQLSAFEAFINKNKKLSKKILFVFVKYFLNFKYYQKEEYKNEKNQKVLKEVIKFQRKYSNINILHFKSEPFFTLSEVNIPLILSVSTCTPKQIAILFCL